MKKLYINKVVPSLFVSILLVSCQAVQASYNASDLYSKTAEFKQLVRDGNLSGLTSAVQALPNDAVKPPLVFYAELIEKSPEVVLDRMRFFQATRPKKKPKMPKDKLDGIAHQWADTLGQILAQLYIVNNSSDAEQRQKAQKALDALKGYYDSLLANIAGKRVFRPVRPII